MKLLLASVFISALALLVKINGEEFQPKLDGLVVINGSDYYISPPEPNIGFPTNEAVDFCFQIGMKLISLQSEEKNQMIVDYLNNNGYGDNILWTSGIRYVGDTWLWSGTGEMFSYTNWLAGRPNQPSNSVDVCTYLYGGKDALQWADAPCKYGYKFICEQL